MTTTATPNVPIPAGVSWVANWADLGTDTPTRYFETVRAVIPCTHGDVAVYVCGIQHADGTVPPEIVVKQMDEGAPVTAAQARQIARALIAAADAADELSDP